MFTHITTRFSFDFLFAKEQQQQQQKRKFSSLEWKAEQHRRRKRRSFANGTHRTQMKMPIKIAKFLLMVYAELCAPPSKGLKYANFSQRNKR